MPILDVPYFVQPDGVHCQATALKMLATYMDEVLGQPVNARDIRAIKKSINSDSARPIKGSKNNHENMMWWIEREFGGSVDMNRMLTNRPEVARKFVIDSVRAGMPVIASTSHSNFNLSHVLLVVGYVTRSLEASPLGALPAPTDSTTRFVCHDPYGRFDPSLGSKLWGKRRYDNGLCCAKRYSEIGPGMFVELDIEGIRRSRTTDNSLGWFYMIGGRRNPRLDQQASRTKAQLCIR
ncbi:MAG: hypothetical protein ACI841_001019 [Planctomycetota bacterium]|jgi:hypothetical protein